MFFNKLKKIYKSNTFPFLVYIFLMICFHFLMQKTGTDDIFFSNACNNTSLWEYLLNRYQNWTSRLVIEAGEVISCGFLPLFIWKFIDIGMYILLLYSISKLIITENKRKMNFILVGSLLCIPIFILAEAGWVSTINNYIWTSATGLYAMIPLRKIYNNEKISIFQAITYILAIIYASNHEQMAGILFIVYACFTFIYVRNKKIKPIIWILDAIIILSLISILLCPGNVIRKAQEIANCYPEYANFGILEKLQIGLTSMMDYCLLQERLLFVIFIFVITLALWKNANNLKSKIFAITPIGICIVFKYCNTFLSKVDFIDLEHSKIYLYFKVIVYLAIIVLLAISLYRIFKNDIKERFLSILIFFTGVISRYIMAFSPTVYASGERTSIFFYISMCMIIVYICNNLFKRKEEKNEQIQENRN